MACITAFVNMQSNYACQLEVCIAFVVQEKSAKNKVNRSKVQLHQKTGSRSYIAYRYSLVILLLSLGALLGCFSVVCSTSLSSCYVAKENVVHGYL
jgi:hypothetical protein